MKINRFALNNYKSIREMFIFFKDINILIGANGAGKSNLISFFSFLSQIMNQNLQITVARSGGADNLLYFGLKKSSFLRSKIVFEDLNNKSVYEMILEPDNQGNFFFSKESISYSPDKNSWETQTFSTGEQESKVKDNLNNKTIANKDFSISEHILKTFTALKVYHFHDTSNTAAVKQIGEINDNNYLREDASNLAAFLYLLEQKHKTYYKKIESTIKLIAPYFDKFVLKPSAMNPDKIRLEWREKNSDKYFNASHLSDGTLRMMCLTTLLLQPEPPNTIIIDEPELGLHPYAINILATDIEQFINKKK